MLAGKRTSAPGIVVHRVLCGPWNQNLFWDPASAQLTCVQNVIEGRGWRLEVLNLGRAIADGRASGPGVLVRRLTFPGHDELEGVWLLDDHRALFAAARRRDNLLLGTFRATEPKTSSPQPVETETKRSAAPTRP
jgi:hypothetical protein